MARDESAHHPMDQEEAPCDHVAAGYYRHHDDYHHEPTHDAHPYYWYRHQFQYPRKEETNMIFLSSECY